MDVLQYLTEYVNEWRSSNNITYSGKLETSDYIKFAQDLQNEITKNVSFSMDSSKTLILYTGSNANGAGIFNDVDAFCNANSGSYYYISNTEANMLWDPKFQKAINETITNEDAPDYKYFSDDTKMLLSGNKPSGERTQYAIEGTDILSLDDFLSKKLTETAIENGNNIVYVAGKNANPKGVGIVTEIPSYLTEKWIGKTVDEAMKSKFIGGKYIAI